MPNLLVSDEAHAHALPGSTTPSAHHIAGCQTRFLLSYVRHELGDEGVAELLAAAGETRSAEELTDVTSRSSYDQFRRPLEAAGALVGGLSTVWWRRERS